ALAAADLDDRQTLIGESFHVATVGQTGGERVEGELHGEPAVALDRAPLAPLSHDRDAATERPHVVELGLDHDPVGLVDREPAALPVPGHPGQAVGEAAYAEVSAPGVDEQPPALVDESPRLDAHRADPGDAVAERLDVGELRPDRPVAVVVLVAPPVVLLV